MANRFEPPSKADIALLPPYLGLSLQQVVVPTTPAQFAEAAADLSRCPCVGFDTESKPCFKPGEVSSGPHVIQLTTLKTAYIFQLHRTECHQVVAQLLESTELVKVGFGLTSDRRQLLRKLGIKLGAVLDMNTLFRAEGYRKELGVKAAVAVVLKQRFQKSKRVSTSNWALPELNNNQLLYAANDAHAAVKVLDAMESKGPVLHRDSKQIPV